MKLHHLGTRIAFTAVFALGFGVWGTMRAGEPAPVVRVGQDAGAEFRGNDLGGRLTIRGQVRGGGKPLAGVLGSDGCRVVRTDAQGEYQLTLDAQSGPFVFVTAPAGWWTEAFYVSSAKAVESGRADFELQAIDQPARFQFAFVTDMHVARKGVSVSKTEASLREINALQPTPAFLWAQGDICLQGKVGDVWRQCLALATMPVRNGAGNHEMMPGQPDPRSDFHNLFGPTYYSFDWAGIHCIVLDGNKLVPGDAPDRIAVHGAVEGSELAWLRADLEAQPKGKPIVVGIHIPIVSSYPQRRRENPKNAPYWEVQNADVLTDLFARHGVRLVLQGHMHENERVTVQGVEYVESISLCGSWFKSGPGMERGVDGSPRGYRLVEVDGPSIRHRYVSSCESHVDRQGELVGLPAEVPAGKPAELVFNCYDAPNGSTAQVRLDGGPWQPMPAFEAVNESQGLKMPHHFRFISPALGAGRHTVEVRVTFPDGTVVTEQTSLSAVGR